MDSFKTCTLCSTALPTAFILDGEKTFCCTGCHVVFNILASKNALAHFEEHSLFRQALQTGLISNPQLIEQIRNSRPRVAEQEKEKLHLEILDMWCPSCAEVISLFLLQHHGICHSIVDYSTDLASIEYAPRYISKNQILSIIKSIGYRPFSLDERERKAVSTDLYLRFIISAFCSLNVMMFAYPLYATYFDYDSEGHGYFFALLGLVTSLPVLFYSAAPIFRRFILSLKTGLFGMETLVVMGVVSSFGLSTYEIWEGKTDVYFDSMTVIITFILLGKIIEANAKFSAKESMLRLNRSLPRRGRKRFEDGSERFVLVKEMEPGDLIHVLSGEKIVLDGVVVEGEGTCDESIMTGEALPVPKEVGKKVLGGSILLQGNIVVQITANADQSALQKIIEIVEKDIGTKSCYVRRADVVVKWFVPLVVGIAVVTGCFCLMYGMEMRDALIRSVSVLLISCPCAIGIAAPLAESYLMKALVNLGAIVRNRGCLTLLGDETVYAFDKTGTVTEGSFTIVSGLENLSTEYIQMIKGMTANSNHLIAQSIHRAISENPISMDEIQEQTGNGLRGVYKGYQYFLGSAAFLQRNGITLAEEEVNESQEIATMVYFSNKTTLLAVIKLGDRLREGMQELIRGLSLKKTVLLSGDSEMAVNVVARACGFSSAKFRCSPLQKRDLIDSLRQEGEIVCFVGDGINDAPALTGANVGISVASASDISIQVSDILLTTQQLNVLPKIGAIAKKGRKIIWQNLFWAFFYNVIGIGLAAFGFLSPIFAAAAMMLSSIMVLFNAKRLAKEGF